MIRSVFLKRVCQAIAQKNRYQVRNTSSYIFHNPGLIGSKVYSLKQLSNYETLGEDDFIIFASNKEGERALHNILRKRIQMGNSMLKFLKMMYNERYKEYVVFIQNYLKDQCNFKLDERVSMKSQMKDFYEY